MTLNPICDCSKSGMAVSAPTLVNFVTDFEQNHHVLHVTAASTYNTKYSNDTLTLLSEILLERNNTSNDVWLMGIEIKDGQEEILTMQVWHLMKK